MKFIKSIFLLLVLISCGESEIEDFPQEVEDTSELERPEFVDENSPTNAKPTMEASAWGNKKFTLIYSDEFKDADIDTSKWNVQNDFYRNRGDIKLYATEEQIEEKDGHLYIYYQKDKTKEDSYLAGRVDSKGKFSCTYGFLECKMHLVKPNGHQTAFWMMPEGDGMKVPEGVDGKANDGAEIDIIEGNKTYTFSCGLHWDGYGANHRSNSVNIDVAGMHDVEYHVIGFEWTPDYLKWYFDGKVVRTITNEKLIPKVPHYLYFSGSMWGESTWVDGSTFTNEFIQSGGVDKAYIDYVRVYDITAN